MFTNLRNTLKNSERGAFDLPSVMVASLIAVILATTLTVSVVALARSAMDNGTKEKVTAMVNGQKNFFASNDRYGTTVELQTQKYILSDTEACVVVGSNNSTYTAVARSTTGNIFYTTSDNPENILQETGTNKYCLP